ncbi:uncharacterized protein BX663DRAFT_350965 [Cokeromyces recurvatus]|uniref:uncharacterized protein n=1 Tax=Cokeromyces recurvatus TaxID=90255 RepID=UPI00221F833E|nr:uncharacterized protein BX663DRAFT_350965 [Cokeromyces recurvatus]KAI7903962.1 hypothetical protein BX663DRAFT_350965 [Cokeromyces recurvatus]
MQSQEEYQVDLNNSREESASSMCDLSNSSNSSHCNTVCFPHSDEDWNSASQKTKEGGQSLNGTFSLKEEAALQDYSFFQLSKEELIQRVVELEREKQLALNKLAGDKLKSPTTILGCNTTQSDGSDEEETYLCRWIGCYFTSTTLNQLITHIKDIHIGSGKAAYYCEWSSCPRKNKPFIKRHKMQNHMRTHTGEKPFECHVEDCDKKFSRLDSLNTHIKTHSNTRPYTCPIENCNKAYFHSRSLRKHAKSHPSSSSSNTTKEFIKNAGSSLSNDPLHIATMIPEKVNIIDPNSSLPIHSKQRQLDDRHPIYQQNNHDLQVSSQEIFVPNFITPVMRGDIQHISPNHLYNGTTNLIGRQQQQQQQTFAAGTAYNNTCIIPSESSFVFHNSQQQPSYDLYLLPSQQMHHSYN